MAGAAAAAAVLPPHVSAVAMKTAVTAMAGAQTTINNQLKAATETATETTTMTGTMMTMETKVTTMASSSGGSMGAAASLVAAVAAWQEHGIGGGGSTAVA